MTAPAAPSPTPGAASGIDELPSVVEQQLSLLLRRMRQFWAVAAAELHPSMQPLGYGVLHFLATRGPQPMTVVAERWKVDKAVLSRQVRQLLDWDLVEAVPCTHDGRVRILHARPAVVEIIQAHRRRGITPVGTALQQWPSEDLQRFSGYLGTLLEVADASA